MVLAEGGLCCPPFRFAHWLRCGISPASINLAERRGLRHDSKLSCVILLCYQCKTYYKFHNSKITVVHGQFLLSFFSTLLSSILSVSIVGSISSDAGRGWGGGGGGGVHLGPKEYEIAFIL